jgi:site-specific DNA recombinase
VWVLEGSRFTRKPIEGERLIAAANSGRRVLTRDTEYDLATASGQAAFRDSINKAAAESDYISERVKRGNTLRLRRGRGPSGPRKYAMAGLATS